MKTQQTNTTGIISRAEALTIQESKTHKDKLKKFTAETLQEEATFGEMTLLKQWFLAREEPIKNQEIKIGYPI